MASETKVFFFHEKKLERGPYLLRPPAPDFKTYIFGIALQFPKVWLKKMTMWQHLQMR